MIEKLKKQAIRSRFVFLASNVAVAVLLGLTNVRAVMVLDSIPFKHHKTIMIKEYEINFSAETFLNDKIEILSNIDKLESVDNHELFFIGNREKDDKAVFTSRILTKEIE